MGIPGKLPPDDVFFISSAAGHSRDVLVVFIFNGLLFIYTIKRIKYQLFREIANNFHLYFSFTTNLHIFPQININFLYYTIKDGAKRKKLRR